MKKVFDKRSLGLFKRLLEEQGISLKKENTLNEVSLGDRLRSFKQAVVGSTGEDAWKDAWDIASSGMSDPEAEKQLYQAAAEWWHSTGKLKNEEAPGEDDLLKKLALAKTGAGGSDLLKQIQAKLKQADAAEKAKASQEVQPPDDTSLRGVDKGAIRTALLQLSKGGIDKNKFASQVNNTINTIAKNAGAQGSNFMKQDVPVIKKIAGEIEKILNGDFGSLKENKKRKVVIRYGKPKKEKK